MEGSRRGEALELVMVATSLEETVSWIEEAEGDCPILIATSARPQQVQCISYAQLKDVVHDEERPAYIVFGTGWGMADELIEACDYVLPPIEGRADFNHLSVRAAAAIVLDRVVGDR